LASGLLGRFASIAMPHGSPAGEHLAHLFDKSPSCGFVTAPRASPGFALNTWVLAVRHAHRPAVSTPFSSCQGTRPLFLASRRADLTERSAKSQSAQRDSLGFAAALARRTAGSVRFAARAPAVRRVAHAFNSAALDTHLAERYGRPL
jgi:hypothetical protein